MRQEQQPEIKLGNTNKIQKELIIESPLKDEPMEWINQYGEKFRELVENDPELKKLLDEEKIDELKQKIKEKLYN